MNRSTVTCTLVSVLLAALVAPAAANSETATHTAGQATALNQPGQVMVDIRLVQLNEPLIEMSLRGSQMTINHRPDEVRLGASDPARASTSAGEKKPGDSTITISASPSGNANDPGVTVISVTDDATLKLGQTVLRLTKDRFFEAIDETDSHAGKSAAWEVLAAPRILAEVGRKAGVTIGTTVPYMVRQDDGCLVVEYSNDINEGLAIELQIDKADAGLVSFKDLSVEINRIAGRQEISGVPFDVGRPIIRSMKISTAMVLGIDHVTIIHLPRATEDNPPIFIFLTAYYVEQE
ncbi:MAG: hypothetical protein ABII12_01140 [Planctomycetota bacterium]